MRMIPSDVFFRGKKPPDPVMGFLWIPQGENQWISTDEKKDFGDQKLRV
jgi:hypothetical protein